MAEIAAVRDVAGDDSNAWGAIMFGWFQHIIEATARRADPVPNPLAGKLLRYLIGAGDPGDGQDGVITEVPYDMWRVKHGISIGYCNLFDENNTGDFGPYLHSSDTAKEYDEGQIDPRGPGWNKNLVHQFSHRKSQGFEFIELDNPDAYDIKDVIGAIDLAASYGLKVVAKNPLLVGYDDAMPYVSHPNIYGCVVEKDAGVPKSMDLLRRECRKPDLPVWFVAFGDGRKWAEHIAGAAKNYPEMRVTYSSQGEYGNSIDL